MTETQTTETVTAEQPAAETSTPATFAELQLADALARALAAENYITPTPIQAAAVPHLLAGRDLLGCAQTGTGKTAAFALPILQRLETQRKASVPGAPQVLVLSPTRELAAQISESFQTYGQFVRFRQTVIYGGVNQNPQVRALKKGVHVVVATPGRLLDLMDQGHISLDRLETFVLDEADRMLDMGFLPDLKRIIGSLPAERQSIFFSATLAKPIAELASRLLQDPVRINLSPATMTVDRIEQKVLFVQQADKLKLLQHLLDETVKGPTLVFMRTKRTADKLAEQLSRSGIQADAIHGNKSQNFRTKVLNSFRDGQIDVLVATDVAARGIDVDGITHVINFDLPREPEDYVHRIGRTGRAGAAGIALSFCDAGERKALKAIETLIRAPISVEAAHPFKARSGPVREERTDRPRGRRPQRPTRSRRPAKA